MYSATSPGKDWLNSGGPRDRQSSGGWGGRIKLTIKKEPGRKKQQGISTKPKSLTRLLKQAWLRVWAKGLVSVERRGFERGKV